MRSNSRRSRNSNGESSTTPLAPGRVEEPLHTEPTHDTTAHLLGERRQIGLGE